MGIVCDSNASHCETKPTNSQLAQLNIQQALKLAAGHMQANARHFEQEPTVRATDKGVLIEYNSSPQTDLAATQHDNAAKRAALASQNKTLAL